MKARIRTVEAREAHEWLARLGRYPIVADRDGWPVVAGECSSQITYDAGGYVAITRDQRLARKILGVCGVKLDSRGSGITRMTLRPDALGPVLHLLKPPRA